MAELVNPKGGRTDYSPEKLKAAGRYQSLDLHRKGDIADVCKSAAFSRNKD
jgi:hypothetical protein